jgi:hypothetical protein
MLAQIFAVSGWMLVIIVAVIFAGIIVLVGLGRPWRSRVTLWTALIVGLVIGVVVFVFAQFRPLPPPPPPSSSASSVKVDVEEESFVDPGVELRAQQPRETEVLFSWRILRDPPRGKTHFITAELLNVDPSNQHNDYYAWLELKGDGSLPQDFGDRPPGSVRVVQVFLVDETCAAYLRRGGPDQEHSKRLCDKGGHGQPDSVGQKISVR